MPAEPTHPPPAAALGLSYDELPEGSVLRREYDGRGGVTITAPAGELPTAVRRSAARNALLPATAAFVACNVAIGLVLLQLARTNRLDPSLRGAAAVTLAVLSGGVFLFVWLTRYLALCEALASARRFASVLHADATRLLVETAGTADPRSLEVATGNIVSMKIGPCVLDRDRGPAGIPCLQLLLRDGTVRQILDGHHPEELRWVAASLSGVTGVPVLSDAAGR